MRVTWEREELPRKCPWSAQVCLVTVSAPDLTLKSFSKVNLHQKSHLEAPISEVSSLELVGSPEENVRQAGFADPGAAKNNNSGKYF